MHPTHTPDRSQTFATQLGVGSILSARRKEDALVVAGHTEEMGDLLSGVRSEIELF